MTAVYLLIFFAVLGLVFFSIRPITTAMHELGHAIPAILLTGKKVTIYLGSYGDPYKSRRYQIGLLEIWFKYNPFSWDRGVCIPSAKEISIGRQIAYIAMGPFASLLLASIGCYLIFDFNGYGAIKMFFVLLCASSIFDLFINLYPSNNPIMMYNGTTTYNDGHSLKKLFKYRQYAKEYRKLNSLITTNKFTEAITQITSLRKEGNKDPDLLRSAISINIELGDYTSAMISHESLKAITQLNSNDYCNFGLLHSRKGLFQEAISEYLKSLELEPTNKFSMVNLGYTYNLLGKYENASVEFDKSIELYPDFAYSYANRGLSKIKLGKIKEGTDDLEHSLKLDPANSYAYRALGIIQLDRGNKNSAKELFIKSKELDSKTQGIDELINESMNMG